MWIVKILLLNLTIVLVTETLTAYILGARKGRDIVTVVLINIITNPTAVIVSLLLTVHVYLWRIWWVIMIELLVVLGEGFMFSKYRTFPRGNPYLVSLVLNLLSYTAGEITKLI